MTGPLLRVSDARLLAAGGGRAGDGEPDGSRRAAGRRHGLLQPARVPAVRRHRPHPRRVLATQRHRRHVGKCHQTVENFTDHVYFWVDIIETNTGWSNGNYPITSAYLFKIMLEVEKHSFKMHVFILINFRN